VACPDGYPHELLRIGAKSPSSKSGQQDLLLAHMLSDGKDAMKEAFCKITTNGGEK